MPPQAESKNRVTVNNTSLDGLRVYDPKLKDAGSADIRYTVAPTLTGTDCRVELTVMYGAIVVACLARKEDASPTLGTRITKYWDGKWGKDKDNNEISNPGNADDKWTGKYVDPKKYTIDLKIYASSTAQTAIYRMTYDLHVVRLGVKEMGFLDDQELMYHKTELGIPSRYSFTQNPSTNKYDDYGTFLNDVVWKLEHIDFAKPAGALGNPSRIVARVEQSPTGESYEDADNELGHTGTEKWFDDDGDGTYNPDLRQVNFPSQNPGTNSQFSNEVMDHRFNRPAAYVQSSPVKIWFKFGARAKSDVTTVGDNVPAELPSVGYPVAGWPIKVVGKFKGAVMNGGDSEANIDSELSAPYRLTSTATLDPNVGYDVEIIEFEFKYKKVGKWENIPGHQATTHLIYRLAAEPQEYAKYNGKYLWIKIVDFTCDWAKGKTTPKEVFNEIWCTNHFWTNFTTDHKPDTGISKGFHGQGDCLEMLYQDSWGNSPKCYSFQHNMGMGNGVNIQWMLNSNAGRCNAWSPFLMAFMGTHGISGANNQDMPSMKWLFVDGVTHAKSYVAAGLANDLYQRDLNPSSGTPKIGDTWYVPCGVWVKSSGQANQAYLHPDLDGKMGSPYLRSFWRAERSSAKIDHVLVKYDGRYYDPSYEHPNGLSYDIINHKADDSISHYYYGTAYVYDYDVVTAKTKFQNRTDMMNEEQIWIGSYPGGGHWTDPTPLLIVEQDSASDEIEEP